jgi:hypothetical protein
VQFHVVNAFVWTISCATKITAYRSRTIWGNNSYTDKN